MVQTFMINLWMIQNVQAVVISLNRDAQNVKMNGIVQENVSLKCGSNTNNIVHYNVKLLRKLA